MEKSYEFYVAGVKFHQLKDCIDKIKVGETLTLVSEPENPYDPNAVAIKFYHVTETSDAEYMLGYVPAKFSAEVTALMEVFDVECTVKEINKTAKPWEQLKVKIAEEVADNGDDFFSEAEADEDDEDEDEFLGDDF